MKNSVIVLCLSLCGALAGASSMQTLSDRAVSAGDALTQIRNIPDKGIPDSILRDAVCIATIPNLKSAAFVFGAAYGRGLVSCRTREGWSNPSYINLSGGSFGFQIGVTGTDLILVFMNQNALVSLDKTNFALSGTAAAAAGPVGRSAQAGTDYKLNAEIVAYSRARGLFAGVNVNGAVLSPNDEGNRKVYGENVGAKCLSTTSPVKANAVVAPYLAALP
jgi:SH3 domain-containing YSC84-like protein 1